ncbi:MAG: hypothetical protein M1305_02975, partial [Candidatus Marsarchaeota archaeon]|nr:hypothetical protein [Candidatus Marsarchaeota archaeon]
SAIFAWVLAAESSARPGTNPESWPPFSIRLSEQYAADTPEAVIAERSRHKSRAVLGQYRREANVFAFDYLGAVVL